VQWWLIVSCFLGIFWIDSCILMIYFPDPYSMEDNISLLLFMPKKTQTAVAVSSVASGENLTWL